MDGDRDRQTEILKKDWSKPRGMQEKARGFCKSSIGLKRVKNRERREKVG